MRILLHSGTLNDMQINFIAISSSIWSNWSAWIN